METSKAEIYEISAVARLTGISPHVLRVWERRYDVVEPRRSETKRRQYSQSDIQRLALLKTLVDQGHAIGSIAKLGTAQLEERLAHALEARASNEAWEESAPTGVCRVALVGTIVRPAVRDAADHSPALRVVGEFATPEEMESSLRPGAFDLLVIERDSIFPEDIHAIQSLVEKFSARRAILVYRFAREDVIQPLDLKRITALRAPVDAAEIQLACIADIQLALRSGRCLAGNDATKAEPPQKRPQIPDSIPPRVFSDEQLVRVSRVSSVVKCECPQHLANLLSSLSAFERYSELCEDRNAEDAALHAFLHRTTAQCRSQMEAALSEVLAQEGVSI